MISKTMKISSRNLFILFSPRKRVGQTGSLPGLPERHIEGVKANCQFALPSRRTSIFPGVGRASAGRRPGVGADDMNSSSELGGGTPNSELGASGTGGLYNFFDV